MLTTCLLLIRFCSNQFLLTTDKYSSYNNFNYFVVRRMFKNDKTYQIETKKCENDKRIVSFLICLLPD